jgi:hypothetical protein
VLLGDRLLLLGRQLLLLSRRELLLREPLVGAGAPRNGRPGRRLLPQVWGRDLWRVVGAGWWRPSSLRDERSWVCGRSSETQGRGKRGAGCCVLHWVVPRGGRCRLGSDAEPWSW